MDSREVPFGMASDWDYNPILGSTQSDSHSHLQPQGYDAIPSAVFHGIANAPDNPFQRQTEMQPTQQGDLQMADATIDEPSAAPNSLNPATSNSHRSRRTQLDWAAHKSHIQQLYFEDKTLNEIIELMARDYNFNASPNLYKTKFKEWGWQKNLPADTALFMVHRAKQRKRDNNKDTIFRFGGKEWSLQKAETTVSRSKRHREEGHMMFVETPQGVTYDTPAALVLSPGSVSLHQEQDERHQFRSTLDADSDVDDGEDDGDDTLRLVWEGRTGPEYIALWKTALKYRDEGQVDEAESHLTQAWTGLCHISGATHEDTIRVAYSLASLYADTGEMDKAVILVERIIQDHVSILGPESRVTQQRIILAAEVLNGWNLHTEALGLLSRSEELLHTRDSRQGRRPRKTDKARRGKGTLKERLEAPVSQTQDEISLLLAEGFDDAAPEKINHGLTVARRQALARNENAGLLLEAIITHCEKTPEENLRQNIVARGELLALYEKLNIAAQHGPAFQRAIEVLRRIWNYVDWDEDGEDSFERFEIMEASLQLIANVLKCRYRAEARQLFEEAVELATKAFGWSDERTIWINITIGIVYQTHMKWENARDWFEQAFSAAIDELGPKDGVSRSLQAALDRQHFSYMSDEGRPYKTVFGVSGIKIMPGRLHLE